MRDPQPHQDRALDALSQWWRSRSEETRHGFIVMPTGSGKTFTAVEFAVRQVLSRSHPAVLWVAHNDYLLQQAEAEFRRALVAHGLHDAISVERVRGNGSGADANVMLASIQMLERGDGLTSILEEGDVDVAIFDEFHHMAADAWKRVAQKLRRERARLLGLSATPFRLRRDDHSLLQRLFPHRIFGVGMSELIRDEVLAEPVITRVRMQNQTPIKMDEKELRQLAQFHRLPEVVLRRVAVQAGRDELILRQYRENPRYGKTIVFCCDVQHAKDLAALFNERRVARAAEICGSAKDPVNAARLDEFKTGNLDVVTSVVLLTEGVDVPSCRTVFLGRPVESPILLQQMIGRAMRGPKAGGGKSCTVVDFVDIFDKGIDLSASMNSFLREFEPATRRFLTRPPQLQQRGIDVALLLRVREFFNRRRAELGELFDANRIWADDVIGWVQHWDGHIQRVLLLSSDDVDGALLPALEVLEEQARGKDRPESDEEALDVARAVYHECNLLHEGVPEEDFVNIGASLARGAAEGCEFVVHAKDELEENPHVVQECIAAIDDCTARVSADPPLRADVDSPLAAMRSAFERARLRKGARGG